MIEQVLWEGRPVDYPPLRQAAGVYALIVVVTSCVLAGVLFLAGAAYFFDGPLEFVTNGVTASSGKRVAGRFQAAATLPMPYTVFPLLALAELWRVARYRSLRYIVTPTRIAIHRRSILLQECRRSEVTSVRLETGVAVIRTKGGALRLVGIVDPEAVVALVRPHTSAEQS